MAPTPAPAAANTTVKPSRSWPVWQLALAVVGMTGLVAGGTWYLVTPAPPTQMERLNQALSLLDSGLDEEARDLVEALKAEGYENVEFAGGIEYALGLCQFQQATHRSPVDAVAPYAAAIVYFREAIRLGVPDDRMPLLTYALATSLYRVGNRIAALPLLEEASHPEYPRYTEAAADLTELYLDPSWRTPNRLEKALRLNDLILGGKLTDEQRIEAQEQRVEILLAQQKLDAASELVEELAKLSGRQQITLIQRARILLGREEFVEAVQMLEAVARDNYFDRVHPRQACFLMGLASLKRVAQLDAEKAAGEGRAATVAAQRAEYRQRALEYFRKTVNRFESSDEAIAADVYLGHLQQEDGVYEKAIQSYGAALKSVKSAEEFTNDWISLEELRQAILTGWNGWVQAGRFPEAIALADLMTPAFPRDQAYELAARARQRWAEIAEQNLTGGTATQRQAGAAECRKLWRESAQAFERLAQARRSAANYPEAVWQATDHYYRAHDFAAALKFVDLFLVETSDAMRPVAMVRRGQILLDMDRVKEAEQDFRQVRKEHPTSPAAFTATYQLAVTYLEQADEASAMTMLRTILASPDLAPAATEWRDSLLLLAQLQVIRATWVRRRLESEPLPAAEAKVLWTEVTDRARESVELLEQFESRYTNAASYPDAQYMLGKALQLVGDVWQNREQTAETDNARSLAQTEMQSALQRALQCFQQVRDTLAPRAEVDRLTPIQQQLLVNSWFELPHTQYALGRYQEALAAYAATVNRFPHDVRVLTAYMQMAECYAHLNRPVEARSMLEQAKVILEQQQIPTAAFDAPTTTLSRVEWEQWLDRARQVHRE